jgi:hypothetical protein
MRTLTEFAAPTLKNAARLRQELVTAGKTPEELPAALGEALKIEGDKLTLIIQALEVVGEKVEDLKRVVVGTLAEGEKAPSGATDKDGKQFVIEYYPPVAAKGGKPGREDRRGGRGERGDRKKGRRGGRGPGRGEGRGEGRGGEKREAQDRGGRPPREPRPPRAPRPERPAGPIPLPKPRPAATQPQAAEAQPSTPAASAPATEATPASES